MRSETTALLNATLHAAATPVLTWVNTAGEQTAPASAASGFSLELDTVLPYEPLSGALNVFLRGQTLRLTEGLIQQRVVLEGCKLYSPAQNILAAEVPFSGSYTGTFYLTGAPIYNPQTRHMELQNVAYDLKTASLILKGAKWLFGKLILNEIKKYTAVDLTALYEAATTRLNEFLNNAWSKGLQANGTVTAITITSIAAQPEQLLIRAQCRGDLQLTISHLKFGF